MGQRLTVLLVTTSGGPYVESTESRIRDRYAVGTALGVACYAPEDEAHLSFVAWDTQGAVHGLPYEWYRLRNTRVCGAAGSRPDSVLSYGCRMRRSGRGFFATLDIALARARLQGVPPEGVPDQLCETGASWFTSIRHYSEPSHSKS